MPVIRSRERSERSWSFANGVAHFVGVIQGREDLIMTPAHARHVLEIMLGCYESARSGRALELTTRFG
jgi:predicted dehydrogenase